MTVVKPGHQLVTPGRLSAGCVAALGAALAVNFAGHLAIAFGGNIPTDLLERDYLLGVLWGGVLGALVLLWPASSTERSAVVLLWVGKLLVTLVVMLAYERQYDFLDSYTYFSDSVDPAHSAYAITAAFGTHNTILLFSLLWDVIPPSFHALKVSCAYVGLIGVWFFYKAWREVVPGTSVLPLFVLGLTPSVLFWSSTLGKDPIVLCGLGAATWGILRIRRAPALSAAITLIAGLALVGSIRPWIAGLFVGAILATSAVFARSAAVRAAWIATGLLLILGITIPVVLVLSVTGRSLLATLTAVSSGWATGGSANAPVAFESWLDPIVFLPLGAFTALFRPLPGEVGGAFGLLAGLENLVLLALVGLSLSKVWRRPLTFGVVLLVTFVLLWSGLYAFLSYQNLGTAVRFKLQVVPFLLALIGLAAVGPRGFIFWRA
jgi:hypothetical protein